MEETFGKKIHYISHALKRNIDRKVEQFGVTGVQVRILGYIAGESKVREVYQRDIEEAFDRRRSTVTNVIQNLEKNGFIKRESVESDARLKKVVLTEKGNKVNEIVYRTILEEEEKILGHMTEEEIEQFYALLQKVADGAAKLEEH